MSEKQTFPFLVYTESNRLSNMRPWTVWGTSADSITKKWIRKYHEIPIKVVPAEFSNGAYKPKETK